MYGFGNWAEVAEHVGTKSKARCIDHYNAIYMNSPCFPLPVRLTLFCAFVNIKMYILSVYDMSYLFNDFPI